jgi:hypothetical protein
MPAAQVGWTRLAHDLIQELCERVADRDADGLAALNSVVPHPVD